MQGRVLLEVRTTERGAQEVVGSPFLDDPNGDERPSTSEAEEGVRSQVRWGTNDPKDLTQPQGPVMPELLGHQVEITEAVRKVQPRAHSEQH